MTSSEAKSFLDLEVGGRGSFFWAVVEVDGRPGSDRGTFGGDRLRVGVTLPFRSGERDRDRCRGLSRSLSGRVPARRMISKTCCHLLWRPQTDPS